MGKPAAGRIRHPVLAEPPKLFLAIDVGNTQTVFALWRDGLWQVHRATTKWASAGELVHELRTAFQRWGINRQDGIRTGVASVVPPVDAPLHQAVLELTGHPPHFVAATDYPFPIRYPLPEEIGADRLADAAGAKLQYDGPVVIVDFGTATTFDYVDAHGGYWGGPIAPGVLLAQRALTAAAAKLPPIDFAPTARLVPHTTIEAMQAGIFHGTVGAVNHLVARLRAEIAEPVQLIATGGLAAIIVPALHDQYTIAPHLTLDGIRAMTLVIPICGTRGRAIPERSSRRPVDPFSLLQSTGREHRRRPRGA